MREPFGKRDNECMSAAYEPFCREALHCFLLSLLLIGLFAVPILALSLKGSLKVHEANKIWFLSIPIIAFEIEMYCTVYRLAILSLVERAGGKYVTQTLYLEEIREEYASSGRSGSIIPRLYPQKVRYGRYKVLCRTEDGKRIKLRCAVNGKNWQIIADQIGNGPGWERSVTYGRYSRVILQFNDKDDLAFILNHRLDMKPRTGERKHPRSRK